MAEGIHLAKSCIIAGRVPNIVMYSESGLQNSEIAVINDHLFEKNVHRLIVKDELFASVSDVHAKFGVLIVFSPEVFDAPSEIVSDSIILETIQDPGNLGTMLRTAAAAGVQDIYLSPESTSAWSPKALRAGMGAQFSLQIYENVDVLTLAQQSKIPVIATYLGDDSQNIYETDLSSQSAWVFGSEGTGVSTELLAACATKVTIPQARTAVESLNVAASVAVCLFEQRRQRV